MAYLIDTDIIIYSLKNHTVVNQNFMEYADVPKSLSVVTYGELIYGARKSSNIERNLATAHRVAELFPLINLSASIFEIFGELKASLGFKGQIIDDMDLLIASTALSHNLVLVTNNEKHFRRIPGLEVENWSK
ncbi:MAG: type II toxin-antitoxin system VapC family toxin [Spirochaetales bacterium]|nr:type II toxin-antitoxin system VapC family toxin [Spirochaetales bacterium]